MSDEPKEPALIEPAVLVQTVSEPEPPTALSPDTYEIKWVAGPGGAVWKLHSPNMATCLHDKKTAIVTRDTVVPEIWWYERDDVPKERLKIEGVWQSQLVAVMNKLRDKQCWLLNTQGKPLEGWWTRLYWRLIETIAGK